MGSKGVYITRTCQHDVILVLKTEQLAKCVKTLVYRRSRRNILDLLSLQTSVRLTFSVHSRFIYVSSNDWLCSDLIFWKLYDNIIVFVERHLSDAVGGSSASFVAHSHYYFT